MFSVIGSRLLGAGRAFRLVSFTTKQRFCGVLAGVNGFNGDFDKFSGGSVYQHRHPVISQRAAHRVPNPKLANQHINDRKPIVGANRIARKASVIAAYHSHYCHTTDLRLFPVEGTNDSTECPGATLRPG
ncbi:hypothetical protein IPC97_00450 [Pseudomonas aeruginosa]|nr:hypothetical protein [Pseudomonas aeruginosa]RQI00703.1 hypothetical protein IPC97_00450 [Pseudomonas aeruginosa]